MLKALTRHVELSEEMANRLPRNRLLTEPEWRALGTKQSCGWDNYFIYKPEPHILPSHRPYADVFTLAENAPSYSTPIDA
ncbi:Cyclin-dependent kinase regulatory subunit 2 [Taenia solium]|eukprot:TsM_000255900 transcript=TsM_000255900 gene=TsM_000255900